MIAPNMATMLAFCALAVSGVLGAHVLCNGGQHAGDGELSLIHI